MELVLVAVAILVGSRAILRYAATLVIWLPSWLTRLNSARVRTVVFNQALAAVLQFLGLDTGVVSVEGLLVVLVVHALPRATNAADPTIMLAIAKRRR